VARIGMLSFAHVHANGYAEQVIKNDRTELVAIWDHMESRGRSAAEKFETPFYSDLDELLALDLDAVVVNVETNRHPEVMVAAARAGKHIFTEKALAIKVDGCDRIIEAVEETGVKFMISLPSRSRKELLLARQAIDDGLLGDLTFGRGRVAHSASLDKWFSGGSAWFVDVEQAGGGALFDLGCHQMDVIRWMMGEPKKVMAIINNVSPNYPIDDNSTTIIEFANKGIGVVDVAFVHRSGPNPFELFGTEGSLTMGAGPLTMTTTKLSDEEIADYIANGPQDLPSAMEQWIGAIEDGTEMTITIQDGRNLTELLQAAYMSSALDKAIELPLGKRES
jgi:1,5-anhydro-D-fructose reductase (1,5-anhydro-D-mannitol-forming)